MNTHIKKWTRRLSGLMAVLMLTMSFAGNASARILFQDDDFSDVDSEGLIINADDSGDEDVTLQFGNDGTDATIIFDDGTGNITFTTSGGDISFGDENLTTTGVTSTGGITSTGVVDFSGSTSTQIREIAGITDGVTSCTVVNELAVDTTTNLLWICTSAAGDNWSKVDSTGASVDLQDVYDNDAAGAHEILLETGGTNALEIRANANGDNLLQLQNSASTNLLEFADIGGTTIDINTLIVDWDATGAFNVDSTAAVHLQGGAASEFLTTAGDLTFDAQAGSVNVDGGEAAIDAVRLNASNAAGGIDIDSGTGGIAIDTTGSFSIDGAAASNITVATDGAGEDLTIGITGATDSSVIINSSGTGADAIDINATAGGIDIDAAAASAFTTSAGALTLDGAGGINIAGNASEIDITTAGALIDINAGSFELDVTGAFSLDGTAASNMTVTGGNLSLTTVTSGDIDLTSVGTLTLADVNDSLTFTSASAGMGADLLNNAAEIFTSTGTIGSTIGIGETSTSLVHAINAVGTYAVSIGAGATDDIDDVYNNSVSGTSTMDIDTATGINIDILGGTAGSWTFQDDSDIVFEIDNTGAVTVEGNAASAFGSSAGDVTFDAQAGSVIVDGGEAVADAIQIQASNAAGGIDIDAGTGGIAVDTTGAFSIDGATSSNMTLTANNGADQTLTIAASNSGAGDGLIAISTDTWDITGAGAASGFTTIDASGNITTSGGDFIIGTTGLTETTSATDSGAFLIGIFDEFDNSASANVQDVMDDIDAAIGIRTYTEDNVVTDNQSVAASIDALDLKWGDLASTANTEGASLVGVEDSAANFTGTDVEAVLAEIAGQIGSGAANVDTMTFEAEYPNAVVYEDGTTNKGKLEALLDSTNRRQYYHWTTKKNSDQDIDLRFRYELPADYVFNTANDLTLAFRTATTLTTDNSVQVIIRNDTDNATCHADAAAASSVANTWGTITITGTELGAGCTGGSELAAGDVIEVQFKFLSDNTNTGFADVGTLAFAYTN